MPPKRLRLIKTLGHETMNPDIGTMIGDVILIGLLGLYLCWVIVENKRDWFDRPRHPTRHISLLLACIGAVAITLHVVGFTALHIDLLWWSMPFLALVCSFILGVAKPEVGIDTAYRFLTLAGPAAILGGPIGFVPLLAGEIGGCLLGFRLGDAVHRVGSGSRDKQMTQPTDGCAQSKIKTIAWFLVSIIPNSMMLFGLIDRSAAELCMLIGGPLALMLTIEFIMQTFRAKDISASQKVAWTVALVLLFTVGIALPVFAYVRIVKLAKPSPTPPSAPHPPSPPPQ